MIKQKVKKNKKSIVGLAAGSLGIVYGDIGTSPLYALRECFVGVSGFPVSTENVLGILSLIVWSLILIISLKYLLLVLRADSQGEGGILVLAHLAIPDKVNLWKRREWILVSIGLFGAALLYGDGIITPALSVLSALEGLEVGTPMFKPYIIPLTVFILSVLFFLQKKGTHHVGRLFAPITFVWFLVLATLGVQQIWQNPEVLHAFNPIYAINFFKSHGTHGTLILGAVFLVVTGGEALYADLGHFGRKPIQLSWFIIVFPSLLLNYFGQGALLLHSPEKVENVFYYMAPSWALYPVLFLATFATIVASQAVISGVFSLTSQAIKMNYFPRVKIKHTSAKKHGQIYVPIANWLLFIGTISLVLGFRSSGNMADAYGIAVCLTMIITSILLYFVMIRVWRWKTLWAGLTIGILLAIDLSFFSSIIRKVSHGGWVPLTIAGSLFLIMLTWRRGQQLVQKELERQEVSTQSFIEELEKHPPLHSQGAIIYLVRDTSEIPLSLLNEFKTYKTIHENIFLLHVNQCHRPYMLDEPHGRLEILKKGLYVIHACYGFMEVPDIKTLVRHLLKENEFDIDPEKVSYILTKEIITPTKKPGLPKWAKFIYGFLLRNATRITQYFNINPKQVVEVNTQVEI